MESRKDYEPGKAFGARVQIEGEQWTLVQVRELKHPPEKVWRALTEPQELRQWAPFEAESPLSQAGTSVKLITIGAPSPVATEERVLRAEAPTVLEYTWGGKIMRWELTAIAAGTRLTLWANIARPFIAMGASGWHICLDVLDRLLGENPIGRIIGRDAMQLETWPTLLAEYAKLLGVEAPKWNPFQSK